MILIFNKHAKKGFSLLELTVVLIITAILVSAVVPQLVNGYLVKAANKTALDISAIQEASRKFYIDNNSWPASIAALQTDNYLPSSWNALNPFPSNNSYTISSSASVLTVSTAVPVAAQPIIQSLLPVTSVSGNAINSSVSVPGGASSLQTGVILPWASSNIPVGFLLCNGQIVSISAYPKLFAVLGTTFGGDGINTLGVPNMQGRTVFGYLSGDPNFGTLGNIGGNTTMIGDGIYTSGHADTANFVNRVKIAGNSLWGMTGTQTAQGVSTAVLNPYIALNYIIKT